MARTIAKDHDAKRRLILKTAAQVFASEGYARASMAQVARACSISKANIYHYYDGKNALLFDILDTYLSDLHARLAALPQSAQDPKVALGRFVQETLSAYDGMDAEHKIQTEGIALLPQDQQARLKDYQRAMVRQLSAIITRLSPAQFADDAALLRATTMSVFGMLNWFYMWNHKAGSAEREAYATLVTNLTVSGLSAPLKG